MTRLSYACSVTAVSLVFTAAATVFSWSSEKRPAIVSGVNVEPGILGLWTTVSWEEAEPTPNPYNPGETNYRVAWKKNDGSDWRYIYTNKTKLRIWSSSLVPRTVKVKARWLIPMGSRDWSYSVTIPPSSPLVPIATATMALVAIIGLIWSIYRWRIKTRTQHQTG